MFIDYTPEQQELRRQLRSYLTELMTEELQEELTHTEGGGPLYFRTLHRLGADGWLGIGWPKEFGGQGRSAIEQYIFFDEVMRAGFPIPLLSLNTVGPTLMQYGSDEQKATYLPRILRGECHFSIGYTEPSAGTDLAALTTRAVRDGDAYVIDGQKVYTSLADYADYIWLAVRTDPEAARHKGISILIVPREAPGVSITPMRNIGDSNIHALYLEGVRVPRSHLVGEENGGWRLITTQLNHERVALMTAGPIARLTAETRRWAASRPIGGGEFLLDLPWVQGALAQVEARLAALELMNWRQAWNIGAGALHPAEASAIKVFGSEFFVEGYRTLMQILGEAGALRRGSAGAALRGRVERYYRATLVLTFGGGTNEVQRDIIAVAGLGMPRSRR